MGKWFEVKITKTTVFAVEVEDDEDKDAAEQYALGECGGFDEVETSAEVVGDENIDRIRRHADEVLSLN